jgi:hypothetical protein
MASGFPGSLGSRDFRASGRSGARLRPLGTVHMARHRRPRKGPNSKKPDPGRARKGLNGKKPDQILVRLSLWVVLEVIHRFAWPWR